MTDDTYIDDPIVDDELRQRFNIPGFPRDGDENFRLRPSNNPTATPTDRRDRFEIFDGDIRDDGILVRGDDDYQADDTVDDDQRNDDQNRIRNVFKEKI